MTFNRRKAIGLGVGGALAATIGVAQPAGASNATLNEAYQAQTAAAGGNWYTKVTKVDAAGTWTSIITDDPNKVIDGASVQKLAVATAVLDKVDRGLLQLDQKVSLTGDIILAGSGMYFLQTVWGDQLTVAGFLTTMLLVSDNTCVRLCGSLCGTDETNAILAAKGFTYTRVEPGSGPNRFFLGKTTPNEMNLLLRKLVGGTLLSSRSSQFLVGVLRGLSGYHDGVRRDMSSAERARVATKYGADDDRRHEAGVIFDASGRPTLTYAMFADSVPDSGNYGGTNPAVKAHAVLGRKIFDEVKTATGLSRSAAGAFPIEEFRPSNGN
ncbi:serine hydrolase [Phytomonospora endophytica]|uniref:Beta-lactamase n=1 Tax=Phytomonospora endophytica TaxID=714109 RepID=A0A841G2E5_9ACTN|nr:serine hydrolase [Phytomonospora endophytica]MBB6038310.1 beta-lactamase class A [Phytomonospora endophytica]GIG64241.1 serine hydrolase [Phytomonospora endophytica]